MNENKVTPFGFQQIQAKIKQLEHDRPTAIKRLHDAAALGDRSENAEYSASKRDLHHLESQLRYFRKQEQYAEVVKPDDSKIVQIGKSVTIRFFSDNETDTYQLVGKQEAELADLNDNKLYYGSSLGQAIMHRKPGDKANVKAPQLSYAVEILAVNPQTN